MSASVPTAVLDDRDLYPLHEEDDMPEKPRHERQNGYLRPALRAYFPGWFITGNVCIYWEPSNYVDYAAPDVLVIPNWQPLEDPRVILTWKDPPIVFVAEIFAEGQSRRHQREKEEEYETLVRAREYLSYHEESDELKLRRLGPNGYEEVPPKLNGRLRSEELQLEFGVDEDGFLWAYTLDGERLMTHEEEKLHRLEAEAEAAQEARRRQEAEALAATEAQRRQEVEARAAEETERREELERQLAALRAQLEQRDA